MNRRVVCVWVIALVALLPFVSGCPGEDALARGLAGGVADGIASVVEDLINSVIEPA